MLTTSSEVDEIQLAMNKMIGKWAVVLLVFLAGGSAGEPRTVDTTCRDPWPQTSSLCAYDDDPSVTEKGVSEEDIVEILAEHNKYRAAANPPAKQMMKLYWNEKLEMVAQKYVQTCPGSGKSHDSNENRKVPGWSMSVGQNAANGHANWADAIFAWYNESKLFTHGKTYTKTTSPPWHEIGHYTQVVRDLTALVGCGFARCGTTNRYLCNYAYGNNGETIGFPYVRGGSPCEGCPGHCSNNLCDCNGLQCLNGELDLSTCTCKCASKLWTGDDCGTMDLGECRDFSTNCKKFWQKKCGVGIVRVKCPKMCGICTPNCNGFDCVHGELDPRACKCKCSMKLYKGDDCGEVDMALCKDGPYCDNAYKGKCLASIVPAACPVSCGLCTPSG